MDIWNLLAGGALVGLVAACWTRIKEITWRFVSLFIRRIEIDSQPAHDALVAYLIPTYRRSRLYDQVYGAVREHHRDGRYGLVPYELFGLRSLVFWNGWWPFLFTNSSEQRARNTKGNQNNNGGSDAAKIY